MRIGSVYTVAVLLGIGALALPTAKPNDSLRDAELCRSMREEGSSSAFMRHDREGDLPADKTYQGVQDRKRSKTIFQGTDQPVRRFQVAKREDGAGGIGIEKRAEKDSSDKTIKDSPDKTIKDSPDKTIKDSPDSSDTTIPDKNAKDKPDIGKREGKDSSDKTIKDSPDKTIKDSPDKTIKDSPDSSDTTIPDKNAKDKRDDGDTPDKIVPDTPDTDDKSKPDKSAKKPKKE